MYKNFVFLILLGDFSVEITTQTFLDICGICKTSVTVTALVVFSEMNKTRISLAGVGDHNIGQSLEL